MIKVGENISEIPELNFEKTKNDIVDFIKTKVSESKTDGIIIGLSGGIDSTLSAYLACEAVGKENVYGDEREKEVRVKRDAFSQWGLIVLGIIIMVIKLLRTESPADIISILFCTSGLGFTYEGIKLRKKYTVACGIALLLASIYFFYKFCAGLF